MPAKLVIFSDGKFGPVAGFALGNLEPVFVPIGRSDGGQRGHHGLQRGPQREQARAVPGLRPLGEFRPGSRHSHRRICSSTASCNDADQVEIAAGESRGMAFDLTGAEEGVLRLQITADGDQLACDNEAFAVHQSAAAVQGAAGHAAATSPWRLALGTKAAAELAEVRSRAAANSSRRKPYADLAAGGGFDLVIYDRCRPQQMPRANTLFIGSLPPEGGWTAKPKAAAPQIIDTAVSHPLLAMDRHGRRAAGRRDAAGGARRGHRADRFRRRAHAGHRAPRGLRGRRDGFVLVDQQPAPGASRSETSAPTGSFVPVSPPSCSTCWATWAATGRCRTAPVLRPGEHA